MMQAIRRWWRGEPWEPDPMDDHRSGVIIMPGAVAPRRHWTSRCAHALVDFYRVNWKWIWTGIGTAALTLLVAVISRA